MRKILFAGVLASLTLLSGRSDAAPISGGDSVQAAADGLLAIEPTQFVYGSQTYCWYPDGWRGPGFYWCGYAYRPGYGWGGGYGWNGWVVPGWRGGYYGRPGWYDPRWHGVYRPGWHGGGVWHGGHGEWHGGVRHR